MKRHRLAMRHSTIASVLALASIACSSQAKVSLSHEAFLEGPPLGEYLPDGSIEHLAGEPLEFPQLRRHPMAATNQDLRLWGLGRPPPSGRVHRG